MAGPVVRLADIDARPLAEWIDAVPRRLWPSFAEMRADSPHPALLTDRDWQGFGERADAVIEPLLSLWPDCREQRRFLCLLVPGQHIPPHSDSQGPEFVARVHVPLISNPGCWMRYGEQVFHLAFGGVWQVNPLLTHSIGNDGETDRIHLFFDVFEK